MDNPKPTAPPEGYGRPCVECKFYVDGPAYERLSMLSMSIQEQRAMGSQAAIYGTPAAVCNHPCLGPSAEWKWNVIYGWRQKPALLPTCEAMRKDPAQCGAKGQNFRARIEEK